MAAYCCYLRFQLPLLLSFRPLISFGWGQISDYADSS